MVQLFYNQYTTKYITLYCKNNILYCVKELFFDYKTKVFMLYKWNYYFFIKINLQKQKLFFVSLYIYKHILLVFI